MPQHRTRYFAISHVKTVLKHIREMAGACIVSPCLSARSEFQVKFSATKANIDSTCNVNDYEGVQLRVISVSQWIIGHPIINRRIFGYFTRANKEFSKAPKFRKTDLETGDGDGDTGQTSDDTEDWARGERSITAAAATRKPTERVR